ncbi:MAG: dienelactone hydrolase family protein [Candidatus Roizmanbacteria bacterium]|nr:dienelactone hydrolase family protein [Candidatus Roizmanbacteria bacterium]
MRTFLFFIFAMCVGGILSVLLFTRFEQNKAQSPPKTNQPKPLERYSYPNLRKIHFAKSKIFFSKEISHSEKIKSYLFVFYVEGKKVTGLANIPTESGTYPIVVLYRGYVDKDIYETGVGTSRVGEALASSGYITLAPDFLGYGESDIPSYDSIEERFQTYTTSLTLLSSISSLSDTLATSSAKPDTKNIGIWAHSNGGQIALTTLEISGKKIPTVLWAPVSKPFPYSVLYYTDEFEDEGKALRKAIADFEKNYDIQKYSPTAYLSWIQAPIQIHQGLTDTAVPWQWSDALYKVLKSKDKNVELFLYPNADHNLMPDGWNSATERTIHFFDTELKNK